MVTAIQKLLKRITSPVFFTLLGVIISSGLAWLGNYQSSHIAYKTSCIARIDQQEATLRDKYSKFLVAMTNFSFSPNVLEMNDPKIFRAMAVPLAASAMEITAYAPAPLTLVTLKVTEALNTAMIAINEPSKRNESIQEALNSSAGSYNAYKSALRELDLQRQECD